MYCRVLHFLVVICLSLAPTSIIAEYPCGTLPTSRVRQRISFTIHSRPLFVHNLLQCFCGDVELVGMETVVTVNAGKKNKNNEIYIS